MITSAISSAVEASAFLTTSRVIGSTAWGAAGSGTDLDLDVPVLVQPGEAARRHDAGGVGLVDEQRPRALAVEEAGAVAGGRLDRPGSAEVGDAHALDARQRCGSPRRGS